MVCNQLYLSFLYSVRCFMCAKNPKLFFNWRILVVLMKATSVCNGKQGLNTSTVDNVKFAFDSSPRNDDLW